MTRFAIFILAVLAVYLLMNAASFYWLRFMFRPAAPFRALLATLFWLAAALPVIGRITESRYGGRLSAILLNLGYIWVGFLFYCFILSILTGVFFISVRSAEKMGWICSAPGTLKSGFPSLAWIIFGILAILVAIGLQSVRNPVIRKLDLELKSISPLTETLTIVQLSDLHLDPLKSVAWWQRIVDRTNALQPDIIVLTGDIIDEDPDELAGFMPGLKRLKARLGIFGVTGNHEFYIDTPKAMQMMDECGVRMLRNEVYPIADIVNIVGLDDPTGIGVSAAPSPDFARLAQSIDPDLPVIVLNHQPIYIEDVRALGGDVQISGHTHDGQLWPFKWINRLVFRYQNGLHRIGDLYLYVSSGTGTWGPPFRIGTISEIVLYRVVVEDEQASSVP